MPNDRERLLVALADASLWLLEQHGAEMHGRLVTRIELARLHPRLHAELVAAANKDCPRVVVER